MMAYSVSRTVHCVEFALFDCLGRSGCVYITRRGGIKSTSFGEREGMRDSRCINICTLTLRVEMCVCFGAKSLKYSYGGG